MIFFIGQIQKHVMPTLFIRVLFLYKNKEIIIFKLYFYISVNNYIITKEGGKSLQT